MSASQWLARSVWRGMLWFIRRPMMKRAQRRSLEWFPARMRESARLSLIRQNRWARRHGLAVLNLTFSLVLLIIASSIVYLVLNEFNLRAIEAYDPSISTR